MHGLLLKDQTMWKFGVSSRASQIVMVCDNHIFLGKWFAIIIISKKMVCDNHCFWKNGLLQLQKLNRFWL
jgi:hypothetical protein